MDKPYFASKRYPLLLLAGVSLLFFPVSVPILSGAYLILLVAVALYAWWNALQDFGRFEARRLQLVSLLTTLGWDEEEPSESSTQGRQPPYSADRVVGKVIMIPPLLVYVCVKGVTHASLLGMRWLIVSLFRSLPALLLVVESMARMGLVNGKKLAAAVGEIWRYVSTPVRDILLTIQEGISTLWFGGWKLAMACSEFAISRTRHLLTTAASATGTILTVIYRYGTVLVPHLQHAYMTIYPLLVWATQSFLLLPLAWAAHRLWDLMVLTGALSRNTLPLTWMNLQLLYHSSAAGFVLDLMQRCLILTVSLADKTFVTMIRQLRRGYNAALRTCWKASLAVQPYLTLSTQLVARAHRMLQQYGIYSWILSLPRRCVVLMDSICCLLERIVCDAVVHTYHLTLSVRTMAEPALRRLTNFLTPVLTVVERFGRLLRTVGHIYFVYVHALSSFIVSQITQFCYHFIAEVQRAADNALTTSQFISSEVRTFLLVKRSHDT
ncbi:hypothetical protein BC832DRAFT_555094 [Gaertneriomyces semiglobifer]|nr:hypothetical protein BC832DRAFT_555094 [Gaertneriomyces semiglobifer]